MTELIEGEEFDEMMPDECKSTPDSCLRALLKDKVVLFEIKSE